MIKAKTWKGNSLEGVWEFTFKIDGVRALWNGTEWRSRKDLPLYNMPPYAGFPDVEVYCETERNTSIQNYKQTIEKIRASTQDRPIDKSCLYSLSPLDARLHHANIINPSDKTIRQKLDMALKMGYEGLILRQDSKWLKVKPVETYDVVITDIIRGKGKHEGRMGALMTPMGKVGTGFTDHDREMFDGNWIGGTIEVACMELTADGKFRHPRFIRVRYDK